ncbi:MAG: hypothetical protein DYG92_12715 [Leptolyngbya sp. PLA1]|nr:hypothetical protein [Leptolyngbya sp. PLA1]
MTREGKIGVIGCLLAMCGSVVAAPEPVGEGGSWLYPRATFEDGRTREADGRTGAMPDGSFVSGDPEDYGRREVCFDQGYTPTAEEWQQIYASMQSGYQDRYNIGSRWTSQPGNALALTWSFAPDGVSLPGLSGGGSPNVLWSRMDTLFGAANRATWISKIQSVFDRWHAITGVTYTRVTISGQEWDDGASWGTGGQAGLRGDVRIGMRALDGSSGVLAFNSFPTGGDMVLDANENWASSGGNYIFLRNIVAHEHGHGLGLPHVCPLSQTKLLEPFYTAAFDGPRLDDIRGVQHMYGDFYENNDTAATATDLGTLANGSTTNRGATPSPQIGGGSIISLVPGSVTAASTEDDWYKFTLNAPQLVNITVTPVGTAAYTDVDQNGDGSCQTSGTTTDPLRQANLQFTVYGSNGTTVFRTVTGAAIGVAETTTGLLLNSGVSYFRVDEEANFEQTQMYTISVTVQNLNLNPTATDGTFADKVRITWPAVTGATGYQVRRATTNNSALSGSIGTVSAGTTLFDDMLASPGVTYYYWVQAQQTGSTGYRYMHSDGEPGSADVSNIPPVANAGVDQVLTDIDNSGAENVSLNGSGSSDTDGTITNYLWMEGPTTLANGASPSANVSLPWGAHTITLTVTDNDGAQHSDTLEVFVNRRPVANAGPDQTLTDADNSGSEDVVLDGGSSTDPDGTITNYLWQKGPTTLASGAQPDATVALAVGTHAITLTVTDNRGATTTDVVVITIDPPSVNCDPDLNQDGNVDQDDVSYLINVVGGGENPSGIDPDFNQDGNVDQDDVSALINVVAGGPCP